MHDLVRRYYNWVKENPELKYNLQAVAKEVDRLDKEWHEFIGYNQYDEGLKNKFRKQMDFLIGINEKLKKISSLEQQKKLLTDKMKNRER